MDQQSSCLSNQFRRMVAKATKCFSAKCFSAKSPLPLEEKLCSSQDQRRPALDHSFQVSILMPGSVRNCSMEEGVAAVREAGALHCNSQSIAVSAVGGSYRAVQ